MCIHIRQRGRHGVYARDLRCFQAVVRRRINCHAPRLQSKRCEGFWAKHHWELNEQAVISRVDGGVRWG